MSAHSSYDAWLERPITDLADQADADIAAWETWADEHDVDIECDDPDHPDHHQYAQWATWEQLNNRWDDIRQAAQETAWWNAETEQLLTAARAHGDTWTAWLAARGRTESHDTAEEFLIDLLDR